MKRAFTLIEILIVIAIIAVLGAVVLNATVDVKEKAIIQRAAEEFDSINTALEFYKSDYGDYPADTSRDIPPGLEAYLAPGIWPSAAWVGSVFDWDNWTDPVTSEKIYQITVRFCELGEPSICDFPDADWASDFDISSGVYYCIEGPCRAHINKPVSHPGYCINCNP